MKAICFMGLAALACMCTSKKETAPPPVALAQQILSDSSLQKADAMGRKLLAEGFDAGSGYSQVWARDLNTFIEIALETKESEEVRGALLVFFRMQQPNNEMVDGYKLKKEFSLKEDPNPYYSENDASHVGFKNTVETDQETSLIQAVGKYVKKTKDRAFLQEAVAGKTVMQRMEMMIDYLMKNRFDKKYGLLWGAMTADWGDVQPSQKNPVDIDETTTPCIDVYDNAMMVLALKEMADLSRDEDTKKWQALRSKFSARIRKHLWDSANGKFIPHIYLEKSPIPQDFDESKVYYHGGTAIAIEAGLLSAEEVALSNKKMRENVKASGAPTIGLTLYPVYPQDFFPCGMCNPYVYQNGGDWTWFGGRMIQQLVRYNMAQEAYDEIRPMVDLVIKNNDFYEWYEVNGKAAGSARFKGSAGALCKAIQMLNEWAGAQLMVNEAPHVPPISH